MPGAKDEVREILEQLGDDVSLEEIQYHIYIRQKVAQARDSIADGRTLTQAEVEERMARWTGQ